MTPMGRFEPLGDGRGSRSEKADNGAELAGAADTVSSAPDTVSELLDALLIPSSQAEGRSSCREEEAKAGYIARGHKQQILHAQCRDGSNDGIGRLFVAKGPTVHL
jgi:hypothetical protein